IAEANESQSRRCAKVEPGREHRQMPGRSTRPSVEDRALAFHGWGAASSMETEDFGTERHREAARRCGISLDQKRIRARRAPGRLRTLPGDDIRVWEQRLSQVDGVWPDRGGHYTLRDGMMRALEIALLEFGGMRSVATVLRTNTG